MTHGTKAVHHFNNFLEGRKYFFFDVTTHVIAARIFYSSLNVFLFFFWAKCRHETFLLLFDQQRGNDILQGNYMMEENRKCATILFSFFFSITGINLPDSTPTKVKIPRGLHNIKKIDGLAFRKHLRHRI